MFDYIITLSHFFMFIELTFIYLTFPTYHTRHKTCMPTQLYDEYIHSHLLKENILIYTLLSYIIYLYS